ncbi:mars [Carabus blaptoides fortunei]
MIDLKEYLKSRFQDYHKARPGFGVAMESDNRQTRIDMQNLARKDVRVNVLLERRNINEMEIPTPDGKRIISKKQPKIDRLTLLKRWKAEKENRMKVENSKKKPIFKAGVPSNIGFPELKTNVMDNIKLQSTSKAATKSTSSTKTTVKNVKHSFAPKDHKFNAPNNIKPIKMPVSNISAKPKTKQINFNLKPNDTKQKTQFNRVTRSQKPVASPPLPLPARKKKNEILVENKSNSVKIPVTKPESISKSVDEKLIKRQPRGRLTRQNAVSVQRDDANSGNENEVPKDLTKKTPQKPSVHQSVTLQDQFIVENVQENKVKASACETNRSRSSSSDMSTVYSMSDQSKHNITLEDNVFVSESDSVKTPENSKRLTTVYVSPFVTTSRGKGSVKKENLERSIRGLPSFTKHVTPDKEVNAAIQATGAAYFHTVLNNEISRLLTVCDTWNQYKQADDVSEDATDMIDVAVGQANLLINKKFQQFRGLITSCENGTGERPVTCEDLQGFWDMVYMQVENLNVRFNRLNEMRNNNWEEIKTEVKVKVVKKRAPLKKAKSAPSSNIRAAIQAARMKSQQSKDQSTEVDEPNKESVFNGGFFVVRSPHKKTPNDKRRSMLACVLSTETNKKRSSVDIASGVTMMRASQTAKSYENITTEPVKEFAQATPGKSILKTSQNNKSYTSKAVLFIDETHCDNENGEDIITPSIQVKKTPEKTPRRKSRRSSIKQ